ncbi:DUF3891 family protein [Fibrisoma montanum]|uniref:DUF3891 family protein n=1 Tax=Fibrisoma montanum TaxID=2305895 RepID=A0A418MH66_9BACT|nr:DUF3891 family protein [Fibrisoma montanum]RIV26770.1 DUF3891 family protein [Fibrisoma montanum]
MIVTQTDTGWRIIHQQAHGLLAFQIALQWQIDKRPSHWVETLVALTEHDDGQDAWEGRNHLTSAGAPMDFQVLEYSVDQVQKMIQIGLEKSRWNALMLSMHTSFLYESMRGENKELDAFLDQQRKDNQPKWRKQCNATKAEAEYAYAFVQWCDALSLILCQDQVPPEQRRLEISLGPEGVPYFILQRKDGMLQIDPWPFETDTFEVHVESFKLTQLVFSSDNELYNALHDAPIDVLTWRLSK